MAKIQVTDMKETLNFNYDVNGIADGTFGGTAQNAGLTMYIYSAANIKYGDASSKTDIHQTGHTQVKGNLVVTVTNNSSTATTEPIYFDVTTNTGATEFTNNINNTKTLLVTTSNNGILAPGGIGTATIEVTHIGTALSDTATFTINLYESWNAAYENITPTLKGTVQVSVSAALLGLTTIITDGPAPIGGAYYVKPGASFKYDITISNTGNAASKNTKITIEPDAANLTIGTVIGSVNSDFSDSITLTPVDNVYTLPSDIAATNGVYYVRVPETVK
ncbi:hypothetical protein [Clostridium sp. D53t1_180928_C8]|uniref:hypothetical protein n=1 Tax=Clostridium sp. D53t1_180928_C8 TaxID=2787101 RepID=UPI0018ABD3B0|nr:hypothetical protein [Clostridium sp. D53t1_180928_C8]